MARIVIEIPDKLNALVDPMRKLVNGLKTELARGGEGRARDYAGVEAAVAEDIAAVERAAHRAVLESLDVDAPRVVIGGRVHSRIGRHEAPYYTLAGEVRVLRTVYRPLGEHNGRTVDPVSLRAGVVGDGWLPRTAEVMAHELQRGTSREAEASAALLGRLPYSRCSFERVGHQLAAVFRAHREKTEDALIEMAQIPAQARSVSASIDRVSIPMEEPRRRPVGRPRKGAPRRPIKRVYRMAYCATVTLHGEHGEALQTIRYGRMPSTDAFFIADALACDIETILRKRPDLRLVLMADGAKEMWGLLDGHLSAEELGLPANKVTRLIDLWHLIEKLAKAARVIYADEEAARQAVGKWRIKLLNQSSAVADIALSLKLSGCTDKHLDGERPVHEAMTYLDNNADRMEYASARLAGLPLGSGNVEATCKSLVAMRMKRPGARWKDNTGEDILHLRALALSDRWSPAMRLTLKNIRQSVQPLKAA